MRETARQARFDKAQAIAADTTITDTAARQKLIDAVLPPSKAQNGQLNSRIFRMVVIILGVLSALSLTYVFFLMVTGGGQTTTTSNGMTTTTGPAVPEIFLSLGSAAVGALAGLISPGSAGRNPDDRDNDAQSQSALGRAPGGQPAAGEMAGGVAGGVEGPTGAETTPAATGGAVGQL